MEKEEVTLEKFVESIKGGVDKLVDGINEMKTIQVSQFELCCTLAEKWTVAELAELGLGTEYIESLVKGGE